MWGQICIESSYQTNFNVGFATYKSDILIHLSQWQYWWWFWFSFVWTFYYFVALRVIKFRTLKMNPRMNTSFRSRGKWGDFVVALIPLSWCGNILLNSNFILRMIEWQNESSLFTVRVHGKQWYWIYKFDLKDAIDIMTAPKNIGNNRWILNTPNDLIVTESYLQAMKLRSQLSWVQDYWREAYKKTLSDNNYLNFYKANNSLLQTKEYINNSKAKALADISNTPQVPVLFDSYADFFKDSYIDDIISERKETVVGYPINIIKNSTLAALQSSLLTDIDEFLDITSIENDNVNTELVDSLNNSNNYDYIELEDEWDIEHNITQKNSSGPTRVVKTLLYSLEDTKSMLKLRFFDSNDELEEKLPANSNYYIFKQKRYKRKQAIKNTQRFWLDPETGKKSKKAELLKFYSSRTLYRHKIFENTVNAEEMDAYSFYKCVRNNRKRSDLLPVNLCRRLLRTKRTLVLPAHVNLTVVTNSYDVVHSWFLPGLGIKLDCVPGRSTHHSLYLDNIGFYYGQCAEICGRYHHHMPIRICALPYEHFLVWWQTKGLPKLLKLNCKRSLKREYTNTKFIW